MSPPSVLDKMIKGGESFIEKQGNRILYNRWVLYFIIFMVFFNLVGHALYGDLVTPLVFVLVAYITTFFSKNMVVVLLMGLVTANIFKYGARQMQIGGTATATPTHEGMENEKEPKAAANMDEPEKRIDTPKSSVKAAEIQTRKKDLDFIKTKYGDLLKLQEQIIENVGSLEKTLGKMDMIVGDVRDNVESLKNQADAMKSE